MRSIFLLILIPVCISAIDYIDDHGFSPDKTDWIDPNDPQSKNLRNVEEKVAKVLQENQRLRTRIAELEKSGSCDSKDPGSIEIAIFKHLLRKLQQKFSEAGQYAAEIRVGQEILTKWNEFLISTDSNSKILQTMADSISGLFWRIRKEDPASISEPSILDRITDIIRSYLLILNFAILIPALALLISRLVRVSRWQLSMWIFFLIFFISVIWTWIHLYKERQAEMQARFARHGGSSEICKRQINISAWTALKDYVGNLFRFSLDDPCVEYYKDIMIDPIWTVSPLEAVSVALTKFFLRPLEPLGRGLARFWTVFLGGIPIPAYFVVLPAMGIMIGFLFLVICGYRLKLGFGLFSLEPVRQGRLERLQGVEPLREGREIGTQTMPAVTWTVTNPGQGTDMDQDQGRIHVRRPSVSN